MTPMSFQHRFTSQDMTTFGRLPSLSLREREREKERDRCILLSLSSYFLESERERETIVSFSPNPHISKLFNLKLL